MSTLGTTREPLWPPEQDARLRELHSKDLSFSQIGKAMGLTKNSVMGRAHRLHLYKRPPTLEPQTPSRPKSTRPSAEPLAVGYAIPLTLMSEAPWRP